MELTGKNGNPLAIDNRMVVEFVSPEKRPMGETEETVSVEACCSATTPCQN